MTPSNLTGLRQQVSGPDVVMRPVAEALSQLSELKIDYREGNRRGLLA
jgi:hypothetical protein